MQSKPSTFNSTFASSERATYHPLRVAVNASYLRPGQVGGSEIYLREVLYRLSRLPDTRVTAFGSASAIESLRGVCDGVALFSGAYSQAKRLAAENYQLNQELRRRPFDVLFSPANFASVLLSAPVPQVATIHDLQHISMPSNFDLSTRVARSLLFRLTFARCARLISISDFTREQVIHHYALHPAQIATVHSGVTLVERPDEREVQEAKVRYGLHGPFFMYPAMLAPHKNHVVLLEAFAHFLRLSPTPVRLVLTGKKTDHWGPLARQAANLGIANQVTHLGFIDHRDVVRLLSGAIALLFPSTFEGFGLPLLEAMSVGTPVLASRAASIPEIAASDSAMLLPASAPLSWAHAMEQVLLPETRARLVANGTRNAVRFSWDACAANTRKVLAEASCLSVGPA